MEGRRKGVGGHGRRNNNGGKKESGGGTFFFRNFPERCRMETLREKFEKIGRVEDIFIPKKRDKKGNRFGFVRFTNQIDRGRALDQLNNTWIGSFIIRAFVPKFERDNDGWGDWRRRNADEKEKKSAKIVQGASKRVVGISYSEMVKGRSKKEYYSRENGEGGEDEVNILQFQSSEEEGRWLTGAFTGHLKGEFCWKEHGEELQSEGAGRINVRDLGSNMILIQSCSEKSTEEEILALDEWASFWLDWWRPWSYTDANLRRVIWTRWIGTALQAWSLRFFCLGCSSFGSLIELHEVTKQRVRLDEAYVRISVGLASIDRIIKCRIDGAEFKIKIEEIKCMDEETNLKQIGVSDSDSDSDGSAMEGCYDDGSSVEAKETQSLDGAGDEATVIGVENVSHVQVIGGRSTSGNQKAVVRENMGGSNQATPSFEKAVLEASLRNEMQINGIGPGPIAVEEFEGLGSGSVGSVGGSLGKWVSPQNHFSDSSESYETNQNPNQGRDQIAISQIESEGVGLGTEVSEKWGGFEKNFLGEEGSGVFQQKTNKVEGGTKSKRKPFNPKDWGTFIEHMASLEEKKSMEAKKKKIGKGARGTGDKKFKNSISGKECWEFGKQLGLTAARGDEEVEDFLEGKRGGEGSLGAGNDVSQ